jgi:steroid delta-isomerase-like uncharacterized protein
VVTREEMLRVVDKGDAAWNQHDAGALAALFSEDARLIDKSQAGPIEGREGIRQFADGFMRAFPDLKVERIGVEIDGTVAVEEWRVTGTQDGELPGLPATHKRATVDGCSVLYFGDDGLVREEHNYWDEAQMLRQLEAMPQLTGAGA